MIKHLIEKKIIFFKIVQYTLIETRILIHFDNKRTLFIDVDLNKIDKIDAIIYYLDNDKSKLKKYLNRKNIRLILFLSRLLKNAKTRY